MGDDIQWRVLDPEHAAVRLVPEGEEFDGHLVNGKGGALVLTLGLDTIIVIEVNSELALFGLIQMMHSSVHPSPASHELNPLTVEKNPALALELFTASLTSLSMLQTITNGKPVWIEEGMEQDFEVKSITPPFVVARRRGDGRTGLLRFHGPHEGHQRFYYEWRELQEVAHG